ncbi:MAG: enolase C-terminal domain-like protein [Polyangiaceae bacterium]
MQILSFGAIDHSLPLLEPFTIAQASRSETRAVLVRAELDAAGRAAVGYGEAALGLRAPEEPAELLAMVESLAPRFVGRTLQSIADVAALVDDACVGRTVPRALRAALYCAVADAVARLEGRPLYLALGGEGAARVLETDVTLPIADPDRTTKNALRYWREGFRIFKVKVGADFDADVRALEAIAKATPDATLRFDANEGFGPEESLALLERARALGVAVDGFEQPCKRDDLEGLARVRALGRVPVIADESLQSLEDVARLADARAVDAVNLKIIKAGGLDRCLEIGREARRRGLGIMVGAMLESRVGLTSTAHLAAALGGAGWVDLDVAFLLARDPTRGGLEIDGPRLGLAPGAPGLGLTVGASD